MRRNTREIVSDLGMGILGGAAVGVVATFAGSYIAGINGLAERTGILTTHAIDLGSAVKFGMDYGLEIVASGAVAGLIYRIYDSTRY